MHPSCWSAVNRDELYQRLARMDTDPRARLDGWRMFDAEVAAFVELPYADGAAVLSRSMNELSIAGPRFVAELARAPGIAARAIPAVLQSALTLRHVGGGLALVKEIVDAAWASLDPGIHGAIRRRYPELFERSRDAEIKTPWPDDDDFPDVATPEGRAARLRYLGYSDDAIADGSALILFQLDHDCDDLGVWTPRTLERLREEAFGRMFARREAPSSMLDQLESSTESPSPSIHADRAPSPRVVPSSTLVARYREGNPSSPIGIGALAVEVHEDLRVVVEHDCRGARRRWLARATPALAPALTAALRTAGFPARPGTRSAPVGASSFELVARDAGGVFVTVTGFDSAEYVEVVRLFSAIVAQVSADPELAFVAPGTPVYAVPDPRR